jgi:hypothetical protein
VSIAFLQISTYAKLFFARRVRGGYKKTTFKYPAPWGGDHLFEYGELELP